jgi:hypothetical protein
MRAEGTRLLGGRLAGEALNVCGSRVHEHGHIMQQRQRERLVCLHVQYLCMSNIVCEQYGAYEHTHNV